MSGILGLFTGGNSILFALGAAALLALGSFIKGRMSGAKAERAKQAEAEHAARDIADQIDDAVAGRSPSANRDELKKWQPKL